MLLRNVDIYQRSNLPGPTLAGIIAPEAAGKMISVAKHPLLITGSQIKDPDVLEVVIRIASKGIPVAATGNSSKVLSDAGYTDNVTYVNLHALTSYLIDPEWRGLDGEGQHDVVVFIGHTYYHASQMLAALKNFAPELRAINIDQHYQPNAYVSLRDMNKQEFIKSINELVNNVRR